MSNYLDIYTGSHALVIGIDDYTQSNHPSLKAAVRSAETVAAFLEKRMGFEVIRLFDSEATADRIREALMDYGGEATEDDDRLLVFFSGHGLTRKTSAGGQMGYLCPYGATKGNIISMRALTEEFAPQIKAKHILFVLDACFSGLLTARPATEGTIRDLMTRKAVEAITAGKEDEAVYDLTPSGRMPFTELFIQRLEPPDPLLTSLKMAAHLQENVPHWTGDLQHPDFAPMPGSRGGGFVFWPQGLIIEWPAVFDNLPVDLQRGLTGSDPVYVRFAVTEAERQMWAGTPQADMIGQALDFLAREHPDSGVRQRAAEALSPQVELLSLPKKPEPLPSPVSTPPRLPFELEMVLIPAGPFLMGSPKSDKRRSADEPEQFELNLDYDYAIGKYPITVGLYRAFMDAEGYTNPNYWTDAGWERRKSQGWTQPRYWDEKWAGNDDLPVVGVSWYEAYAYTRWLAEATGRDYRLPTEAEWEKAARGGLQIPDAKGGMKKNPNPARIWPWGDEPPTEDLCNFNRNYPGGRTSPVTSHAAQAKAQPYGLYHMAGNVWEWCLSKWADPFVHPEDNNPEGSSRRVLRGGSCYYYPEYLRVAYRGGRSPFDRSNYGGFRAARSYQPQAG